MMMSLPSINPANNELIDYFDEYTDEQVQESIQDSEVAFQTWKGLAINKRIDYIIAFRDLLDKEKNQIGEKITSEMGRPVKHTSSEIEKCIDCCNYYIENAERILQDQAVKTDNGESIITYEPLGVILGIMPWNFPFWQAIRAAVPTIIAGNTFLLKHASNVTGCAYLIEKLFTKASLPSSVFQVLPVNSGRIEEIIPNPIIKGITLTGGEYAGSSVASIAGREIKKCVLELGGSDPFIVLPDADVSIAAKAGVESRLNNGGQSCTSAKRFLIHKDIYNRFEKEFVEVFKSKVVGDPTLEKTDIGPLALDDTVIDIRNQVEKSKKLGAKVIYKGKTPTKSPGYYYPPTILSKVTSEMPVFQEELFGPVAALIECENLEEIINLANNSRFGLGASVWSQSLELAKSIARRLNVGSVAINKPMRSDVSLPFGGVNKSGFGRELGEFGIKEFVNIKVISC